MQEHAKMKTPMPEPYVVIGTGASYYTGKLLAYFKAKGIPYRLEPFNSTKLKRCIKHTGVVQIPQVECPDGTWLIDTTQIIAHFEAQQTKPALTPASPALNFLSLVLEDYADEWLWRPAMHYRWSYAESARLMCGRLAEHADDFPGPFFLKKAFWRIRQTVTFVRRDGINATTRGAAEASYLDALDGLEAIFEQRPFILGEHPTQADFGFFASMYAHFFCDPTPGRIMRERAPAVTEWVARMWNANPQALTAAARVESMPTLLEPLLQAVTSVYLPYLRANELAQRAGASKVSYRVQNVEWHEPTKPYRVWCLDQLRRAFAQLDAASKELVATSLNDQAAVELLSQAPAANAPAGPAQLPIAANHSTPPVDSWGRDYKRLP